MLVANVNLILLGSILIVVQMFPRNVANFVRLTAIR